MDRTAGTGLIGSGVVIAVIGAILKYAVTLTNTGGFNLNTAGLILLIAGIVLFALGVTVIALGGRRRVTIREDVRSTGQGQERVQQRSDSGL